MKNAIIVLVFSLLLNACKESSTDLSPESQSITANQRHDAVNSYVNSYHGGLRLLNVSTKSINVDGKASKWLYCYVDTTQGDHPTYYFHATINEVGFDSTSQLLPGPSVITLRWFDSDSAMVFAELHGGAEYRSHYSNLTLTASLSQSLIPNSVPKWTVMYLGGTIPKGLIIDATSGALIGQTK